MNRYNFFPGDYLRATVDLSMMQDGAYRRLIDWCFANEKPIPTDESRFRVARAFTDEEREATQWVLDRFFEKTEQGYVNARIEEEIAKALPKIRAAKANGSKGGRPRKTQQVSKHETETGTQNEPQNEPKENQSRNLPPPPPSASTTTKGAAHLTALEGSFEQPTTCPPDFTLPDVVLDRLATEHGVDRPTIDQSLAEFRSYWTEGDGKGQLRKLWPLRFREHLERQASRGFLQSPPKPKGRRAARATSGPIQRNTNLSTEDFLAQCGHG